MITKMIDDLINRLHKAEYQTALAGNNHTFTVLNSCSKNEEAAIRSVVAQWMQDNFIKRIQEVESLNAKVFVYEECMRKSTFAPFVETKTTEENHSFVEGYDFKVEHKKLLEQRGRLAELVIWVTNLEELTPEHREEAMKRLMREDGKGGGE